MTLAMPARHTQMALKTLNVPGSSNLGRLVLSNGAAPQLEQLDLSCCGNLQYVFVQSATLQVLRLTGCTALTKVRRLSIHCNQESTARGLHQQAPLLMMSPPSSILMQVIVSCPSLNSIELRGCAALSSLLLVAGEHLKQLDLSDCKVQPPAVASVHAMPRQSGAHAVSPGRSLRSSEGGISRHSQNELGNSEGSGVWMQAMQHRKLVCPALSPDALLPALQRDPVPAPRTFQPIAETLWVHYFKTLIFAVPSCACHQTG